MVLYRVSSVETLTPFSSPTWPSFAWHELVHEGSLKVAVRIFLYVNFIRIGRSDICIVVLSEEWLAIVCTTPTRYFSSGPAQANDSVVNVLTAHLSGADKALASSAHPPPPISCQTKHTGVASTYSKSRMCGTSRVEMD